MRSKIAVFVYLIFLIVSQQMTYATTLAPELKAYDFAQAYYIEDGGVVLAPYHHGFYCDDGNETPEGIRIMPGKTFMQYDPSRMIVDEYKLLHLNKEGTRAFFHQNSYRYKVTKDAKGKFHYIRGQQVAENDFYLSQWRSLEWFDFAFPEVEVHPGGGRLADAASVLGFEAEPDFS